MGRCDGSGRVCSSRDLDGPVMIQLYSCAVQRQDWVGSNNLSRGA
jgi:hypothetical protein